MAVAPHFQAISLGLLVIGAAATPTNAQVVKSPVVETKISPAHAQAEFAAASKEMKRLVGEMTVLQAEYQQPGSDKKAVEAKFAITKDQAQTTSSRLETAAFALAMIEPRNPDAQQICGAVVAAALQVDDPFKAIKLTEMLSTAGAASGDVMLMGATAAISLSQLDEATIFLKKAIAAGIDRSKVDGLEQAIQTERPKVDAEMLTRKAEAAADDLPRVKMTTSKGPIVIELFENEAPNSVANFIALVEKGFYNGTPFHRVIGGFMAQGGDPTGSGTGGPGHVIDCECEAPGARKHFLGTLSMAHAGKNTGGSQFFLTFRPTEHLDGKHTVFGRVIEGFDVLPQLNRTEGPLVSGQPPDTIVKAEVIRKRNHPYEPKTRPK